MGLTSSGYLRARDEAGRECELHPDGNSLDMMQGLIKRKVTT
jgi:biotin--protein ligase